MSRWFRVYEDMVDDPKVQMLAPELFKILVNIWCIASKNDGMLPMIDEIAFTLRVTPDKVEKLLQVLTDAGLLDETDEGIVPHNWNHRQFKSDVSTERVKQFRKRQRNVSRNENETPPETESDTETEKNKTTPSASRADFEEFWKVYPKRDGSNPKELAWEKFKIQVKDGADPKAIVRAARKYADECERLKENERKFIKQARYWLSGKVWKDYDAPEKVTPDLVPVFEGTAEWDERIKAGHSGITTDIRDPVTQRYRRGWYFKTEGPPGYKTSDEIAA